MKKYLHNLKTRAWIIILPVVTILVDSSLTLYYQPRSYFNGNISSINEANEVVKYFMQHGWQIMPVVFFIYICVMAGLILILPKWLALWLSLALILGHFTGAWSWLWEVFGGAYPIQYLLPIYLGYAGLMVLMIRSFKNIA